MDRVLEIEVCGQRGEVIRVMIHIVAIGPLARTSMPAPIMRDDAIAMVQEKHHLRVPVIRSERPAVRKHNRLSFTPVLVENLCAVLRRDRAHGLSSFSGMGNGCSVGLFGRCERCGVQVFFTGTLLEAEERARAHHCADEGGET